jgi:putative ABC transport system permease protein
VGLSHDARHAVRILRRTPALTWPAVASLALGIAVNTTMFSVVNAVLLKPLGRSGDGELVRIGRSLKGDQSFRSSTLEEFRYLRDQATSLSGLTGHQIEPVSISGPDRVQVASSELVTAGYFSVLRVPLQLGRDFGPADDQGSGGARVVILSHRFWHRHFGADPNIVGRSISLNGGEFSVIGVSGRGFAGTFPGVDTDLWLPATTTTSPRNRPEREPTSLNLIGRLKPGISMQTAAAEFDVLARRLAELDPERGRERGFVLGEARGAHPLLARVAGMFLMLLMAVVSVVLLVACANVASLLLARASGRHGELAVRLALGARRRRLISQLLVESGVLALAGGMAGLVLALMAIGFVNGMSFANGPTGTPIFLDLQLDTRVLLFTATITILTTLVFGLVPAIQASRVDLITLVKSPQPFFGRGRSRLRGALLVLQVALSCVLLIAAGLLFRSLRNAGSIDVGFDPEHVVIASFNLEPLGYDRAKTDAFFDELLHRTRLLPGVERAALADYVPMGDRGNTMGLTFPDSLSAGQEPTTVAYNRVSDGYFATIRQPLMRGRDFTPGDVHTAPPVVIVNEALARRYWPGGDPIGKHAKIGDEPAPREIVGVVKDAKFSSFGDDVAPFVFFPARQIFGPILTVHVRTTGEPADALAAIRRLAAEIDRGVAPRSARTMREEMGFSLVPVRIAQGVFSVAGAIGLMLALGGLYGLVCYTLAQRTREIGIRIALGATRQNVFRVIVGGTVRLTLVGVAIGVALAAAGTRLLSALLYGLSPTDPLTFAGIAALLVLVTVAAGYVAVRKGLTVDPVVALRHE